MTDEFPARRATVRSEVAEPATVAGAIAPDDTDDIGTRVEDDAVVTTIERPTTSSLEATLDDYVVALEVATSVVDAAARVTGGADGDPDHGTRGSDRGGADTDTDTDDRGADDEAEEDEADAEQRSETGSEPISDPQSDADSDTDTPDTP